MQSLILSLTLIIALALLIRAEMLSPSRHPAVRIGLLVVIILALTGLLGLWGLPLATDLLVAPLGT